VQFLNPGDYQQRIQFCEDMLGRLEKNNNQVNNLWMSNEAHFHLSGFVNKQNFRYWSDVNPHLLHETSFHSQKVIVWCAILANRIIGPFFLENEAEDAVTVNFERYIAMIRNFLTS